MEPTGSSWRITMGLVIVVGALIGIIAYARAHDWTQHPMSFGGEAGLFRVDHEKPPSFIGGAGQIEEPSTVFVHVGDTIDVLVYSSADPVRTSDGRVVLAMRAPLGSPGQHFEAIKPGTAMLSVKSSACGTKYDPSVRNTCSVLDVTVLP